MKNWFPIWMIPILIVSAALTVWLRLSIIDKTYEISQMDRALNNTNQEMEKLRLKVTRLKSPRRLESLAKTEYHLYPPTVDQIVHVQSAPTKPTLKKDE